MTARRLDLPPFRPRPPWFGGYLQTVRNALMKPAVGQVAAASSPLRLPVRDGTGDVLHAMLDLPARVREDLPLVLLAHGVSGSAESYYMRATAARLLPLGYRVLRLNLRGAGPSRPDCRRHYHGGRSGDLRDAIAALPSGLTAHGVVTIGFSLGGNTVLKLVGEQGTTGPVRAAVAVCAPIDLGAATRNLNRGPNRPLQSYLLKGFKAEYVAPGAELTDHLRAAVHAARSFAEFDETVSAPRNGAPDVATYYAENSARAYLPGIRVPTLVIAAEDDPIVPFAPYGAVDWPAIPDAIPAFTRKGGHVAHHGAGGIWYLDAIERFLATV
ncbi:MAG: alpha/beta fold hydrolase [Zavarzinia sp.]|nr:alpha/beta fold hydrolase [Zavarzinia sp.]